MRRIVGRCKESSLDAVMFLGRNGTTDLKVTRIETILSKGLRSPAWSISTPSVLLSRGGSIDG